MEPMDSGEEVVLGPRFLGKFMDIKGVILAGSTIVLLPTEAGELVLNVLFCCKWTLLFELIWFGLLASLAIWLFREAILLEDLVGACELWLLGITNEKKKTILDMKFSGNYNKLWKSTMFFYGENILFICK